MISDPPRLGLLPFVAYRPKYFEVVWSNSNLRPEYSLQEYVYICPAHPNEEHVELTDSASSLLAERYGGQGVGENGGGARCGNLSDVQVKGVGRNMLVGNQANFWHAHGGASLVTACREAIWGEVTSLALPFGGVRAFGVVRLPSNVKCPSIGGPGTGQRALVLREICTRPAHFMRAVGFKPTEAMLNFPSDTHRCKEVIAGTVDHLLKSGIGVSEILREHARRIATQAACARAKRLIHGNISASNIALDGRWIDFDSITALSDFGRLIMGAFDLSDFWSEFRDHINPLKDLCFYMQKYSGQSIARDEILNEFVLTYKEKLSEFFLNLTGIPATALLQVPEILKRELFNSMKEILSSGNEASFYYSPKHTWEMPEVMGDYHLPTILLLIAICETCECAETTLAPHLTNDRIRKRFIVSYWKVRSVADALLLQRMGNDCQAARLLNCGRVNSHARFLYRRDLDNSIRKMIETNDDLQAWLDQTIARAKTIYQDAGESPCAFDFGSDAKLSLSAYEARQNGVAISRTAALRALIENDFISSTTSEFVKHAAFTN
jgi:hypothetical protein